MPPRRHLHLDPVGGIAGDMLAAALLDAAPELQPAVDRALAALGLPPTVTARAVAGANAGIRGSRLAIEGTDGIAPPAADASALRQHLAEADLPGPVRARALDILDRLTAAEAKVHGIPVEEVHFHELASWDTLIDVAAAATLVEGLGIASCSTAPLPLGGGRIRSAHGLLPVPAPATAELIRGLPVHDDGIQGERVTPTGAAILAHLRPGPRAVGTLQATGIGLGTRQLPGLPNMLRALLVTPDAEATDMVGVLRFEVDDQTGEELAAGLDRVRAVAGVLDVCAWPVTGKKGRLAVAVQVLCAPAAIDEATVACFAQTSTIGLRTRLERRAVLPRSEATVETDAGPVRIKRVERLGGTTAKAEADDLAAASPDLAARRALQRRAEDTA